MEPPVTPPECDDVVTFVKPSARHDRIHPASRAFDVGDFFTASRKCFPPFATLYWRWHVDIWSPGETFEEELNSLSMQLIDALLESKLSLLVEERNMLALVLELTVDSLEDT